LSLGRRGLSCSHPGRKAFLEPEFGKHGERSPLEVGSVKEETVRSPEVAKKKILGDRQVRNNIRLLVNHPNAEGVGVGRRPQGPPNAAGEQLSLVGRKDALEYPHKGRFSRAVFPNQCEYLARPRRQRHIIERLHHAKSLRYSVRFQRGGALPRLQSIDLSSSVLTRRAAARVLRYLWHSLSL
jgi:hypothetical protein